MGLKYSIIHILVHIVLVASLYLLFQPDLYGLIIILIGTAIIDLDHLNLWLKYGIVGYFNLRGGKEFGKPRKYLFHNLITIAVSIAGSMLVLIPSLFLYGLFSLAAAFHLLWDFFEDVIIFKIGIKHWRI